MSEDKALPMSGKRRNELTQKGNIPRSMDITTTAILAAGLVLLLMMGSSIATGFEVFMHDCFHAIGSVTEQKDREWSLGVAFPWKLLMDLGLFAGGIILAAVASQMAQVGFVMTDKILEPNFDRFNPIMGMQRFFSLERVVTTIQATVKLLLIIGFCYSGVKGLLSASVFSRPVGVHELGKFLLECTWVIGWRCILGLGVIAAADYIFHKWKFEHDNRMSLDEVKEEFKQTEGSLEMKMKRRQIARKQTIKRMLENLRDATVVVTNPTHYAVGIRYQRGITPAPIVVAKGMRRVALRIREECLSLHIPVLENKPLARGLYKHAKVGEPIPVLYYQAVAVVLAQLQRQGLRAYEERTAEGGEEGEAVTDE